MPVKMKRKDLEEVNDDFSDFSLSSPARKIRRLDAELPPIMEEDETDIPLVFEQPRFEANNLGKLRGPIIEELPTVPDNDERAIVLFKPMSTSLLQSPSGYSISVDSDIISGFKNQGLWCSSSSNLLRASKDEEERLDNNNQDGTTNRSLAVVPWVPSKFPQEPAAVAQFLPQTNASDLMEAEEAEATTMDIEDESTSIIGANQMPPTSGMGVWPQHCIVPEPPQNTSTPIVWFR